MCTWVPGWLWCMICVVAWVILGFGCWFTLMVWCVMVADGACWCVWVCCADLSSVCCGFGLWLD